MERAEPPQERIPATISKQQSATPVSIDIPEVVTTVRTAGYTRFCVKEWERITKDKYIISAIQGYKIEFKKPPFQPFEPKYKEVSIVEADQIDQAVIKLLTTGAIEKCKDEKCQFVSTIFTVPKSDGGYRLVLNLKKLNEFIHAPHFKMEDIRTAITLLYKDAYMAVVDQKEAFHRIPIDKNSRKYLRFRWKSQLYQYTCVPFGLSLAPYLFTKIMKPVLAELRSRGYESISFLDDALLLASSKPLCSKNIKETQKLFIKLGLEVNILKSQLSPSHQVRYLGFFLNSNSMTIILPKEKQQQLKQKCENIMVSKPSIHDVAVLIGKLVAASFAINYSPLYIKQLEMEKCKALIKAKGNYDTVMVLSEEAQQDIKWWISTLNQNIVYRRLAVPFSMTMITDASKTGWGASYEGNKAKGSWSVYQKSLHINTLELLAVYYAILSLVKESDIKILLRIDNTTAISYVNRYGGCRTTQCHSIAKLIWQLCESKSILLHATYVNTKENIADPLSREAHDNTDFMLGRKYFAKICDTFFVPNIDLFASYLTNQCHRYVSYFPDPFSENVDAFSIKWEESFYAFPPFNLLPKVLQKIETDKSSGIVVAPYWTTQPWFPRYAKMANNKFLIFKPNSNLLFCPHSNRSHSLSKRLTLVCGVLSGNQ